MSLIGWWKLDGNAYDSSPSVNHGVVTGVTYDPSYGKIGQGANFIGGGNSYIDFSEYTMSEFHSITFWMYGNVSGGGSGSQIMGKGRGGGNWIAAADTLNFTIEADGFDTIVWDNTNDVDFYHRWRHVVIFFITDGPKLFIDGVEQINSTGGYGGIFELSNIGASADATSDDFIGYLNDVRVYDHVLSMKEIKYLVEAKVLHWQFSQERNGSGAIISDSSDYWRDTTLDINAPTWSSDTGRGVGSYDIPLESYEYIKIDSTDFPVEFEDAISISLRVNYDEFNGWQTLAHGTTTGEAGVTYNGEVGVSYLLATDGISGHMRWSINGDTSHDFLHGMTSGNWYHIVATYDGIHCNVYINGVEKAGNFAQSGTINNQNGLKIGLAGFDTSLGIRGRHAGVEGTGYVLQADAATNAILIKEDYITIDGIEVNDILAVITILVKIETGAIETTIKNCILHGHHGASGTLLGIYMNHAATVYVYNNIIYDIGANNAIYAGIRTNGTPTLYAYNNTLANIDGQGIRQVSGTVFAKNNLAVNCEFGCFYTGGSFGAGSDYNASDDDTSTGGAQDRTNQTFSFVFAGDIYLDPSFSAPDLHLAADDTGALGWGENLHDDAFLSFTTDIDGEIRGIVRSPSADTWDIGADEYTVPLT